MNIDNIVKQSDQVVARNIEGEMIIIPLTAGVGNLDEELYSLNEIGQVIWEKLDANKTLESIIQELAQEYSEPVETTRKDVLGFVDELASRRIVITQQARELQN